MIQTERDQTIIAMEHQAHEGLGIWVQSHLNDLLSELPYDPNNPNQWIDRVALDAKPSLEMARRFGEVGMGEANYNQLIRDLQQAKVVEGIINNRGQGESTLIATLHLQDTLDTAITHNSLFVASDDPEFAEINVILANFIMSRMALGGVAVDEVLTLSGKEVRALPAAAVEYIEPETIRFITRLAIPAITDLLNEGIALHRAPTGTRATKRNLKDGTPVKIVPVIDEGTARTLRRRTPTVVGIPMNVEFGNTKAEVLAPRKIETEKDLHRLMTEMVEIAKDLSGEQVFYGLPKGARGT